MSALMIAELLMAIAAAARAPGIGQEQVAAWASLGGRLIRAGGKIDEDLRALSELIKTMVDEDREPNAAEWESLRQRSAIASAEIQSWSPD